MSLTVEDVKDLTEKYPNDCLGVKVQAYNNKDRKMATKAMLVLYLQHTDVMNRLDKVDPSWHNTVLEIKTRGELFIVRMTLTLKGIVRENVGEGYDEKSAYSDALKRCAMLFGVGRYLYDSEQVWIPFNPNTDMYNQYTFDQYEKFRQSKTEVKPNQGTHSPTPQSGQRFVPLTTNQNVNQPQPTGQANPSMVVTDKQLKRLFAIQNGCGWAKNEVLRYIKLAFNKTQDNQLNQTEYNALIDTIQACTFDQAVAFKNPPKQEPTQQDFVAMDDIPF